MTRQKGTLLLAAMLVAGISATSECPATAASAVADDPRQHLPPGRPHRISHRHRAWQRRRCRRRGCRRRGWPRQDGAANGAAPHAAKYTGKYTATHGDAARECTADGNATHSAAANGQPDCPAAAIPSGARIAPAAATVGAGTVPSKSARSNVQTQTKQQQANTQTNSRDQLRATRDQLRAERTLRRTEARELRRLPASQRAAKREQIDQAREQRALARQQLTQPNAAQANTNRRNWRENRRNGMARVTPDAARQGRFAARFAQQAGGINPNNRWAWASARNAWRDHHRARFVAWFGPVFWPYAYSDVFNYAFWPSGYDDGYWAYAYDDFFDGVFWGDAGAPDAYAYAPSSGYASSSSGVRTTRAASAPRPSYASVQELCRQPGNGVTAWPFGDIERKVGLNGEQKQLLDDVRRTSEDAAAGFKASCPAENAFPLTPPGRLAAMTVRLEATLQTVQTVRPPLEKFYASLSDEQKERFNLLGPQNAGTEAQASVASQAADTCKQPKQGLTNLPIEKIEDALNPTDAQQAELMKLQDATNKAVSIMQTACPDETPMTPPGRLNVMEKRLQSMVDAAKTVKPALENFYASLSSEQKARFNRIGQQLARTNG